MFTPSTQQQAFFDALSTGSSNLLLSACAGSGKTTTIVEALKLLPAKLPGAFLPPAITFLAFNKSIAETLKSRCPSNVSCSTFHSLGMRALKASGRYSDAAMRSRDFVNGRKMSKLLYNSLGECDDTRDAIRLASVARSRAVAPADISDILPELVALYDYTFVDERKVFAAVSKAIAASAADVSCIDFDEMLYLPVVLGCSFDTQDFVFVDESQDTNDIQLEILWRLGKKITATACKQLGIPFLGEGRDYGFTTRFVFVGDPHQAIYGFRGANADSMSKIAARFACTEMPLDVSFRCPQLVVEEAQKFLQLK